MIWVIFLIPIGVIFLLIFYTPTTPPPLTNVSSYRNLPNADAVIAQYNDLILQDANLNNLISTLSNTRNNLLIEIDTLRAKIALVAQ